MKTNKYTLPILLAMFALAVPPAAQAGAFVSGAIGFTTHSFSNVSEAAGASFSGGWHPNRPYAIGVEFSYINGGSAGVAGSPDLQMSGFDVSGMYMVFANQDLSMYVKAGVFSMNTTWFGSGTSSGLSAGYGLELHQTSNFSWYADMDILGGVTIPGTTQLDYPLLVTVGGRYHFR